MLRMLSMRMLSVLRRWNGRFAACQAMSRDRSTRWLLGPADVQPNFSALRSDADEDPFLAKQFYSGCKWAAITCAVIAGPVTGGCVPFCQ